MSGCITELQKSAIYLGSAGFLMSGRIIRLQGMAVSVTVFSGMKYRQPDGDTVT
jgi:hypothetical protein